MCRISFALIMLQIQQLQAKLVIVYRKKIKAGMFFRQGAFRKCDIKIIHVYRMADADLFTVQNLRLLAEKTVERGVGMNGNDIFY